MITHSFYSVTCLCERTNAVQQDCQVFMCACGRKSIIDFSHGYSREELLKLLDEVDAKRDRLARVIGDREK